MEYKIPLAREVADAMQQNFGTWFLDISKKEVIFISEEYSSRLDDDISDGEINEEENETDKSFLEDIKRMNDDPDNFLAIPEVESSESFQIMEDFISEVSDSRLKNNLERALIGAKPFRTFRFVLEEDNDVLHQWYKFRDAAYLEKAKEFLSENNIEIS